MNILITGASGMIGRATLDALVRDTDFQVYAATSRPETLGCLPNVTVIHNDRIQSVLQEVKIDTVLHGAFPRNVSSDRWADGIRFAMEVLTASKDCGVKNFVHLSSQSIYGLDRAEPADESHPIRLTSPYTTGKFCMEEMTKDLFSNQNYTNIRLSTVVSRNSEERVCNKFLRQVQKGEDIRILGGKQVFSFLDVRDAADGLRHLLHSDSASWKSVYNLGTAESATLLEIAELAVKIGKKYGYFGSKIRLVEENIYLNNRLVVSSFAQDFGWLAQYSLEESMEDTFLYQIGQKKEKE